MSGTAAILASNRAAPTPAVASTFAKNRFDWETLLTTTAMPTGGSISRTGNAMYYDSTGLLTYAPNNLLLYSEQFNNAAWSKPASSVSANVAVAPDGTTTADKLVEDNTTNSHKTYQDITSVVGTVYTVSIYAKAAERNILAARIDGLGNSFVWFNLSTGTIGTKQSAVTAAITNVGNGWYRCSVSGTATATNHGLEAYVTNADNVTSYTGDGSSGIYIWGAQMEAITYQTSPRDYLVTTTAARFEPRFDTDPATLQPKGLLVEGARTNIATYSENFATTGTNWAGYGTIPATTSSGFAAPDGTTNAYKITAGSAQYGGMLRNSAIILGASTTYAVSIYAKAGNVSALGIRPGANGISASAAICYFNLSTGVATAITPSSGSVLSVGMTPVGNSWYRCWVVYSNPTSSTGTFDIGIVGATGSTTAVPNSGDNLYVWGLQAEVGGFVSSYLPNGASTSGTARAAETFTFTGYANRLVEAYYIDEQTGVAFSGLETIVTSGAVTINPPAFGWVTSLRAYINAYAGDITTPSWIDNSGTTGNRTVTDSTGALTWAPANMLLNSATLSTQSVTTLAQNYILSFQGTGSVTCSGTNTTVLAGTGASNRVSAVLACTAGTLTLTVSGSVTSAQLEPVTYQTAPRDWIPTTSAAVFMPRYDYDASTTPATPRGMLIEEARANLLTYSNSVGGTNWINTAITYTGNSILSPDGTTNASLFVPTTASGLHYTRQIATVSSGATVTVSVYAKAGAYRYIGILEGYSAKGKFFDLSAGAALGNFVAAPTSSSITAVGNGWYRLTVTATVPSTSADIEIYWSSDGTTYNAITGDGISGFYLFGAQVEAGSFATSYIPTTTASVTRVADVVKMTSAAFGSYWNASAGTMAIEGTAFNYGMLSVSNGTTADRYYIIYNLSGKIQCGVVVGSSLQAALDSLASGYTAGTVYRTLLAYKANDFAAVTNNGTVVTDTSGTLPTVSELFLGSYWPTGTSNLACGYIRSFAYYKTRLPDATLKTKSTVGASF